MKRDQWLIFAAALVLMAGAAGFLYRLDAAQKLGSPGVRIVEEPMPAEGGSEAGEWSVKLPESLAGYESQQVPVSQAELDWLPEDTTFGKRMYRGEGKFEALLSVVVMGTDRTSIHKPQICLTGQGWTIERTETVQIPIERPHRYELEAKKLTASIEFRDREGREVRGRGLYVYWFVADGQLTSSHSERMWWMARDLIREGVLQRWAYIACFATFGPGEEEATFEKMKRLIADAVPEFQLAAGEPSQLSAQADAPALVGSE